MTTLKVYVGAEKAIAIERVRMAVAEAGYPESIGRGGELLDYLLPPDVVHRAWALATQQEHVTFDEFVVECLKERGRWRSYFNSWGVAYPQATTGGDA